MSTFKGLSQSFITREIGDAPFPVACAGYGLLALRRYCTGVQILNKVQPAPGQVITNWTNYSKNLKRMKRRVLERQTQAGLAPAGINSVFERQLSTMRFRNLPAENQAYPGPCRFGGEKWDKKIGSIRNTGTVIDHPHFYLRTLRYPTNLHAAVRFQRSVGGITNQVDEQLLQLIDVRGDDGSGSFLDTNLYARLQLGGAMHPLRNRYGQAFGLWKPGQSRIGRHKS